MVILWYPALRSAAPMPFASSISNPYWERDQYDFEEGPFDFETVEPTGKPEFKPGTGRGHYCGTEEDFRDGGHYDPLAPLVTYGMQGLPTCCGAPVLTVGGVIDGGTVGVEWPFVPGASCAAAAAFPLAETVEVTKPPAGLSAWAKFPVVAGEEFQFTWTRPVGSPLVIVYSGPDCLNLTIQNTFIGNTVQNITFPATEFCFLEFVAGGGLDYVCTLRADPLP